MRSNGFAAVLWAGLAAAACSESHQAPTDEGVERDGASAATHFTVSTERQRVEAGGERLLQCQSFRLDNDEALFVSAVEVAATPGVHHADWYVLPDDALPGPEGSSDCANFGFGFGLTTSDGGAPRGSIVFSQATQSLHETQRFGEGAALEIPAQSQLFVSFHLLNIGVEPADIGLDATFSFVARSAVSVTLTAGGGLMGVLELPALSKSRFSAECLFDEPPTFAAYYVMPHYHSLGTGLRLELVGGPRDREVLWSNDAHVGEASGSPISPPVSFEGASGFRFSCSYDNPSVETVGYGARGADEMCSFFVHTSAGEGFYGVVSPALGRTAIVDQGVDALGVHEFSTEGCVILPL